MLRSRAKRAVIALGSAVVELRCADAKWRALAAARWPCAEVAGPPVFTVTSRIVDAPLGPCEPVTVRAPATIEVRGAGFRASADLQARSAFLSGPRSVAPLAFLLRELLPWLHQDGLVVHAAALQDGDRGLVCPGPSGAGKSTLAALLADRTLADDLVVVRRGRAGLEVESLPYRRSRPGRARVAGVFHLVHGPAAERRRLAGGEALRRLCREVRWPLGSPALQARCLDLAGEMVESVPQWELAFAPRADVWEVLAR